MTEFLAERVVRAHAKINLVLRVLAREANGYHGIETVLQRLALHDVVRVKLGGHARTLSCSGSAMPSEGLGNEQDNLAWRAAEAYAHEISWDVDWQIGIDKRIPVGGGLGGGSADAAAVLRAMEAMSPTPLGASALLSLAGTLGADVPFCMTGAHLALAWGRGDRVFALPALPRMAVTLITFADGVSTARAYAELARRRANNEHIGALGAHAYATNAFGSWESVCRLATNDFESVVAGFHPGVAATLSQVRAAADQVTQTGVPAIGMMSGSGATCVVVHPESVPVDLPGIDPRTITRTATTS